jgi:hypothetical protein
MKRLVYSPKVSAYVKADRGIFDISDYITAGGVERKLDQVSTARLTVRNPDKKWTDIHTRDPVSGESLIEPMFHPMDPIVIVMQRLQERPVQVFTGFLDRTPYLQLHPGTIELSASCTLKKLQYTFFDAGLPFLTDFLGSRGWNVVEGVGIVNLDEPAQSEKAVNKGTMNDSGFGELLFAVLQEIGTWPKEAIFIESIPNDLVELVTELFETGSKESKEANEEMIKLLHKIIGTASLGNESFSPGEGGGVTGSPEGTLQGPFVEPQREFAEALAGITKMSLRVVGAWCLAEESAGAAQGYAAENYNNWLNMGPFEVNKAFDNPQDAAKHTADNINGGIYDGTIVASIGKSDQKQMQAIVDSPWGTEATIFDTYQECSVKKK